MNSAGAESLFRDRRKGRPKLRIFWEEIKPLNSCKRPLFVIQTSAAPFQSVSKKQQCWKIRFEHISEESTVMLAALRGCTLAQWCFELNAKLKANALLTC